MMYLTAWTMLNDEMLLVLQYSRHKTLQEVSYCGMRGLLELKDFYAVSHKSQWLQPIHPVMLPSGCRGIGNADQHSALETEAQKKRRKKKNAAARRRAQAEEEAAAEQSLDSAGPVEGAVPDDWPAGVLMTSQA